MFVWVLGTKYQTIQIKSNPAWQRFPRSRMKWHHDALSWRDIMTLYLCTEMVTISSTVFDFPKVAKDWPCNSCNCRSRFHYQYCTFTWTDLCQMLFFIHLNSGYLGADWCLLAIWVFVWHSWLSGSCLHTLGHPGTVWHSWLSRYCLTLLAINISLFAWTDICQMLFFIHFNSGYLGTAWCSWLSGSLSDTLGYLGPVLMFLAIRVLGDTLGYPGIVWRSWLYGYCLTLLAINISLFTWTDLCQMLFFIHFYSGYPGAAWCSWLSGSLTLLAIRVLSDTLGYPGTVWCS